MLAEIDHDRRRLLSTAAMYLTVAKLGLTGNAMARALAPANLPAEGDLPSLAGATTWLNSQPLTTASLRGKVVLVNFWTYTCINSLRALPYVRAWAKKYKDQGLVVVGVQAPEFSFEKNVDNIRWALNAMRIDYPVAIDNNLAVWRAFNNEAWPAFYFADARGRIRHHQLGEGDYQRLEIIIQQLLVEAGARDLQRQFVSIDLAVWKLQPIGTACTPRRPIPALNIARVLHPLEAHTSKRAASTHTQSGLSSIIGRCKGIGPSAERRLL
jgi:thiol-disulfide isomerase/thioredoxin